MPVYADHAATASLLPEAREAMLRALDGGAGNPSSLHAPGRNVRRLLGEARERCAAALGARVEEIVFTSGATESDNLAVVGTMRLAAPGDRVLISALEHPAVREAAGSLEHEGFQVDVLPVDACGKVDPDELTRRLAPETRLVAVMAVNNEIGVEQDLPALADRCARAGVPLHCDAVQAAPTRVLRPGEAGVDFMAVSGHKIGGTPGAGLLYVRRGRTLAPLFRGGGQEDGRRPGTENVPALLALAVALERAAAHAEEEAARLGVLRERLESGLSTIPGARVVARGSARAPQISAWTFEGLPAEQLVVALDMEGIAVSSGSACSSHSVAPSRVLLAVGYPEAEARGLVRFSFGWATTPDCIDRLLEVVPVVVERLRSTRGRQAVAP